MGRGVVPVRAIAYVALALGVGVPAGQAGAQLPGARSPDAAAAARASAYARGAVVTDTLWSQALGAFKSLIVYLPPSYRTDPVRRYPVAYYLHGATGDETNWTRLGGLDAVMDSLVAAGMPEMIVAMPDGDAYSYYSTYNLLLDAAGCRRTMLPPRGDPQRDCVAWPHYDDYIAFDVIRHVDARYRTVASRERRALGGLSMGGYGAVTLALQHPGLFAAAASHSGVLAPLEFAPAPISDGARTRRTAADSTAFARVRDRSVDRFRVVFGTDSASWYARDPASIAARHAAAGTRLPALFADCGSEDVYCAQSRAFVERMAALGLPVAFREWAGDHNWAYWRAHVGESLAWIAARIATGPR